MTSRPPGLIIRVVSKTAVFVTAAAALLLGWANGAVTGVLASLGLGVVYVASLRFHPRMRHTGLGGCKGTGEHHSPFFPWTHRRCGGCESGRRVRWGAGHFGSEASQGEYDRNRAARAARREQHTWR